MFFFNDEPRRWVARGTMNFSRNKARAANKEDIKFVFRYGRSWRRKMNLLKLLVQKIQNALLNWVQESAGVLLEGPLQEL